MATFRTKRAAHKRLIKMAAAARVIRTYKAQEKRANDGYQPYSVEQARKVLAPKPAWKRLFGKEAPKEPDPEVVGRLNATDPSGTLSAWYTNMITGEASNAGNLMAYDAYDRARIAAGGKGAILRHNPPSDASLLHDKDAFEAFYEQLPKDRRHKDVAAVAAALNRVRSARPVPAVGNLDAAALSNKERELLQKLDRSGTLVQQYDLQRTDQSSPAAVRDMVARYRLLNNDGKATDAQRLEALQTRLKDLDSRTGAIDAAMRQEMERNPNGRRPYAPEDEEGNNWFLTLHGMQTTLDRLNASRK